MAQQSLKSKTKKTQMKKLIFIIAFFTISVTIEAQVGNNILAGKVKKETVLKTNEDYIRSINTDIDLGNTLDVFAFVFGSLNPVVNVYPTENYYYYQFETSGKTIKGNIALFADKRDEGKINFAFEEINNLSGNVSGKKEGVAELDNKNGVIVRKVDDFEYDVVFNNKTVKFLLNQIETHPSSSTHLRTEEICIGPSQDESGLKFFLIFNKKLKNFFWLLNEEDSLPESFVNLVDNVEIGKRTEFVFYEDQELRRKILFGVKYQNIRLNNWFDGPFDQLPDNYIKSNEIELKKYIEEAYPEYLGKIDKYGHFLDEVDTRVAISSYLAYNSYIDVLKVYYACKNSSNNSEEFIFNLTKERYFEPEE